mmetsp:Transcript_377/g.647  ORF Transcript_377/g.647 Transcript_377/m.647 type:complete len:217 (-) Transcript_377:926-1576(-)
MLGSMKSSTLHQILDEATNKTLQVGKLAVNEAVALSIIAASHMVAGRERKDAEIAIHFNSGLKFGLAGSNGGILSNYLIHTRNNHEILSLFFADRRNPYNKQRRLFVIFSKLSLSFCLAASFRAFGGVISSYHDEYNAAYYYNQLGDAFIISVILTPYGFILDQLAQMQLCTSVNRCVCFTTSIGYCALITIALVSICFLAIGIVVILSLDDSAES